MLPAVLVLGAAAPPARAASVDLTPGVAVAGSPVAVEGSGFPARRGGTVRLSGTRTVTFRADAAGRFTATLQIPSSARPGDRRLTVRGGAKRVVTTVHLSRTARPVAVLTASSGGRRLLVAPASGAPGAVVRVRLSGVGRRTAALLRLGGQTVLRARADRRGRIAAQISVPAVPVGRRALVLTTRGTRLTLIFTVVEPTVPDAAPVVPVAPVSPPPVLATGTRPPSPPPLPTPPSGPPLIAAAGDIACAPSDLSFNGGAGTAMACRQRATSDLLVSRRLAAVLPLGDNQYESGTLAEFNAAYHPSWGRVKAISRPVAGNHEYLTPGAAGYFDYFGAAAGGRGLGYYSYTLGGWHIIALNSNCAAVGGCAAGSEQERWLREELALDSAPCTLAYWHEPLFTSGGSTRSSATRPFWDALYADRADVILVGHSHNYERFAPQSPAGGAEPARGIRQFVVGTGGEDLVGLGPTPMPLPTSEKTQANSFGVLTLTLRPGAYDWRFVPAAGYSFTDSGTGSCR